MKKFLTGLLVGGILTTSITAFAATAVNIKAVYSIKKLVVDGVDTGKGSSAFVSNGTTYVPLRTVSDALGHKISWDSSTKTIYINKEDDASFEPTDLPPVSGNLPSINVEQSGSSKLIGIENAKKAAIKAVGGGQVISSKSDIYDIDDVPKYEFKIRHNNRIYEVDINALTGVVMDFDQD